MTYLKNSLTFILLCVTLTSLSAMKSPLVGLSQGPKTPPSILSIDQTITINNERYTIDIYNINDFVANNGNWTLLHLAAACNDVNAIEILINTYKANLCIFSKDLSATPLHCAAFNNNIAAVKTLVFISLGLNKVKNFYNAINDHKKIDLFVFLHFNNLLNAKDNLGNTALNYAQKKKHQSIVSFLKSYDEA